MENFFDVATPEEVKEIFGEIDAEDIALWREIYQKSPDGNYGRLFELYLMRDDKETAFHYYNKISDVPYKIDLYNTVYMPWDVVMD